MRSTFQFRTFCPVSTTLVVFGLLGLPRAAQPILAAALSAAMRDAGPPVPRLNQAARAGEAARRPSRRYAG